MVLKAEAKVNAFNSVAERFIKLINDNLSRSIRSEKDERVFRKRLICFRIGKRIKENQSYKIINAPFSKLLFIYNSMTVYNKNKALSDGIGEISLNPKFELKYKSHILGSLHYESEVWIFNYSDWFINQNDLKSLFEFPSVDKTYVSFELWPFFESRIPSIKQPKIQEYLESHPSDRNNKVKLLELFGITSVNNPYKLVTNF